MKLNIGCKRKALDGFINIDVIKTPVTNEVIQWLDIDNVYSVDSVDQIKVTRYSISRLSEEQLDQAIPKWYKILKNHGSISITGHDLIAVSKAIGRVDQDQDIPRDVYEMMFGFTASNLDFRHKRLYRPQDIVRRMKAAGFEKIKTLRIEEDNAFEIIGHKIINDPNYKPPTEDKKPKNFVVDQKREKYEEFFVYGLQRSGTNFLQRYISNNTTLTHKKTEWKHIKEAENLGAVDRLNIYIYKSPYKWVESIARNHEDFPKRWGPEYPIKSTGDGIVTIESTHRGREKDKKHFNVEALVQCYNDHLHEWFSIDQDNVIFVQYEELIKDPQEWLADLGRKCEFTVKSTKVPDKVPQSHKFTEENKQYYTNPEKLEYLTREQIDVINATIDPQILNFIKYKKL